MLFLLIGSVSALDTSGIAENSIDSQIDNDVLNTPSNSQLDNDNLSAPNDDDDLFILGVLESAAKEKKMKKKLRYTTFA